MKTILITGGSGMLGYDATRFFTDKGFKVLNPTSQCLDITQYNQVESFFKNNKFDFILHCAAYTQVDLAETEIFKAFLINHYGTFNLSIFADIYQIPFIYISTDYVFDGTKLSPYLPYDTPNPLNIYGKTKLAGEEIVKKLKKYYIARVSGLYGLTGKNFVNTILTLANNNKKIKVVDDQFTCPTFSYDLITCIYNIILNNDNYGIYHICSSGKTSWYQFAQAIVKLAGINNINIIPIKTELFKSNALRPKFSVMCNNGLIGDWYESLKKYFSVKHS